MGLKNCIRGSVARTRPMRSPDGMLRDGVPACVRVEAGGVRGRCCARDGEPFAPSLSVSFRSPPLHAQRSRAPEGSRLWGLSVWVFARLTCVVPSKNALQAHSYLVWRCWCPCGVSPNMSLAAPVHIFFILLKRRSLHSCCGEQHPVMAPVCRMKALRPCRPIGASPPPIKMHWRLACPCRSQARVCN